MRQSLYSKLVLVMLVLILSLMLVVGVFLIKSVEDFFTQQFYEQMQTVFDDQALAADLRSAARGDDAPERMSEILSAYYGQLGIDSGTRNFYILSSGGEYLAGSESSDSVSGLITPNVLSAMNGHNGYMSD